MIQGNQADLLALSSLMDLSDLKAEKQDSALRQIVFYKLIRPPIYPSTFPVEGIIQEAHRRIMIMLVCRVKNREP
jgi:hypothetical protein